TIVLIIGGLYGLGQKGILIGWENRFPAFSTMNEEFAKGIPLQISALGRVSSTFAGHYDLAAYLVLIIPIVGALVFGLKRWWQKIMMFGSGTLGLIVLMMTASRVSFAVYLLTIVFMLILHKQKKFIIPVVILSIVLLQSFEGLSARYASTISSVDVVIDARTGKAIGVSSGTDETGRVIVEEKELTGENLPQGSGYINLPNKQTGSSTQLSYRRTSIRDGVTTTDDYEGEYVVRKALAYDVSFTTRFQGTWPRAIEAFQRNPLLGSGYSSISLASDNNYLRILGEVGLLGLLSYVSIFLIFGIYVAKILPHIGKGPTRSFVIGVSAGIAGVALNAVLIDVFEASKVAFVLWGVMGLTAGLLTLYKKEKFSLLTELKNVLISVPAIVLYLFVATFGLFLMMAQNFFVGDDFTWLRWAAECVTAQGSNVCVGPGQTVLSYFTQADQFFYRPGTKLYFYGMYAVFWIHNAIYHYVSILLHFLSTAAVFLLVFQVLKSKRIAFLVSVIFLTLSVHFEQVFWISATGHLIATVGMLFSVILYIYWKQEKHLYILFLSLICALTPVFFHEFGIVTPLLILAYDLLLGEGKKLRDRLSHWSVYLAYLIMIPSYLALRYSANSHWQGGDYTYNLLKLPVNVVGNIIGYFGITFFGTSFRPFYDSLRMNARENIGILLVGLVLAIALTFLVVKLRKKLIGTVQGRVLIFGFLFFIITLLPFVGLGNITYRYAYLPSVGIMLMLAAGMSMLLSKYKTVGVMAVLVLVTFTYSAYQYYELTKINKDWQIAGTVTRNFVNDIDRYYTPKDKLPKNAVLYFANVPIMYRTAWIFPVGLEDALYLPFQSNPPQVVTVPQVTQELLDRVENSRTEQLFEFEPDGDVTIFHKTTE
ncbi:MAG TPA: O-antigen ligase family protein, partial [Candidatus Levybacteria bacterium]|nr:O-antigen ligase family protein [Candidatus Levybacteria bacterium]